MKPFSDEEDAIQNFEKNPNNANSQALANIRSRHAIMLSKWAKKKGNMDAYYLALLYAQSATDLVPDNGDYWFLLGHLYWQMKGNMWTILMAEDALHKAVGLNPEDDKSRLLLGQTLFYQDSFAAALEQFETVVKRNSKTVVPEVIAIMYSAYILDYQSAKGIDFFQSLLKSQPDADCARLALGILLHQQEKKGDAENELKKIINRPDASTKNRARALRLIKQWNGKEVAQ
jgi:tetratricopeptide (TPR) repeat protein